MPFARKINAVNFRRYGLVIACPAAKAKDKKKSIFSIVLTDPAAKGWRIAHLLLRDKAVNYLERHIDSFESFEPLKGKPCFMWQSARIQKESGVFTWINRLF